jgi:hypothetical protein
MPSSVPLKPLIPITLDKPRHLRMTNRAIFQSELELTKLWGRKINVFSILVNADQTLTLNDIAVFLWQALLHEDPSLTLPEVQDMVDVTRMDVIFRAILQAWNAATAPAEPVTPGEGTAPHDPLLTQSSGPVSGPIVATT